MFEFHGWAVLRANHSDQTTSDTALLIACRDEINRLEGCIKECFHVNPVLNDCHSITVSGRLNHYSKEVIAIFQWIAENGIGSYGLIHILNDEGADELNFHIWRLARGQIEEQYDPFLSPVIPVIEDPYDS